jgi:hypothetical protein
MPISVRVVNDPIGVIPPAPVKENPPLRYTLQLIGNVTGSKALKVPRGIIRKIAAIQVDTASDDTVQPERIVSIIMTRQGTFPIWNSAGHSIPRSSIAPAWREMWMIGAPDVWGRYNPFSLWPASHFLPDLWLQSEDQLEIILNFGGTITSWITYYDVNVIT